MQNIFKVLSKEQLWIHLASPLITSTAPLSGGAADKLALGVAMGATAFTSSPAHRRRNGKVDRLPFHLQQPGILRPGSLSTVIVVLNYSPKITNTTNTTSTTSTTGSDATSLPYTRTLMGGEPCTPEIPSVGYPHYVAAVTAQYKMALVNLGSDGYFTIRVSTIHATKDNGLTPVALYLITPDCKTDGAVAGFTGKPTAVIDVSGLSLGLSVSILVLIPSVLAFGILSQLFWCSFLPSWRPGGGIHIKTGSLDDGFLTGLGSSETSLSPDSGSEKKKLDASLFTVPANRFATESMLALVNLGLQFGCRQDGDRGLVSLDQEADLMVGESDDIESQRPLDYFLPVQNQEVV
ncbi:hypothetical protein QBC44DRAFT_313717 [Cladorrhinum sp. PSN332]|nr:hypothetical protein QBC44DRAFT_313717 [Cladorrhinum sp. PSN332]